MPNSSQEFCTLATLVRCDERTRKGRSPMFLSRIRMRDYRCHASVDITLGQRTLLIGGNGAGKTSVLEAIDKVLGAGRRNYGFREQDLAPGADELQIDLEIRPDDGLTFTAAEHGLFETHVDVEDDVREVVRVRAIAGFEDDGVFRSRGVFVKADGNADGNFDQATRSLLNFFFLPAARDARREFDDRAGLWSRLTDLLEAAHDPARLDTLTSAAGQELVGAVLGEDRLNELGSTVQRFVSTMYGDTNLEAELRATAVDFRSLMRGTSLVVGRAGQLVPLTEHSTGVQTLALFGLFRAFLDTAGGHLVATGLEEPEIHLAPHVARSLVALASESGHQVILTSHSPAISDAVPIGEVRVLRRTTVGTVARALDGDLFDSEELARIQRELRSVGTEFLFSRAVLLCEGASERGALPEFGRKHGVDLDLTGVSVLSIGGSGFGPYLKLLGPSGFDIPHVVVCDNDAALAKLVQTLDQLGRLPENVSSKDALDANSLALLRSAGFFSWTTGDLERYLVGAGGYPFFEEAADFLYGAGDLARFRASKVSEGVVDDDSEIIGRYVNLRRIRKPELAAECAARFIGVPAEVGRLLEFVQELTTLSDPSPGPSDE